ncbi:MAG: DUF4199 domain-containing protein [Flavobacterium psychrophilum]|nr:MAG: DUF4199 domain-containing protein [Flavobacterium psychrophilum]
MKKLIWTYGLIGGLISTIGYLISTSGEMDEAHMTYGMIYGFASMIVAFSLMFIAIKTYRDKQNGGSISFGKAFLMGLWMALITSTIYVIVWLIALYNFHPDFAEKYTSFQLEQMKAAGATVQELQAQASQNAEFVEQYKNPVVVILYTYMEILPIGLLIALIAAAILKKKPNLQQEEFKSWAESQE